MTAEQKQDHRNLIKEYNIHFDGPIDRAKWPPTHFQTFSNIQKLGRTVFVEYHESITIDSEDNPWREQTKRRAERIMNLAKICREGRKNEAGWRMSLESEILARFTIEVACRRCRARLWRSELEATASSLDRFSESLEERQKKRMPCVCRPGKRGVDVMEQGVNLLFDDRAQEAIIQDIALQSVMQKKEEPDRVYGLRMMKRLERLLKWTEDKRAAAGGKMIGDSIKSTPFRPDGDPIVFPFLALEAKSEKGRDSFSDIEAQTAFTIRSLLTLQEDLRRAAGEDSEWESGPLVWFLANKGEQWRVAGAYIEYKNDVQHYRIVDLWEGRIISTDGALQLLLIVDYIFDWARDIYREAIVGELRSLAANNTTSLGNDSEVFSLEDRITFLPELPQIQEPSDDEDEDPTNPDELSRASTQDYLKAFDSPLGVLRDVTYIRSRFIALYITEDNLSVLMKSMTTPDKARKAVENILRCLKDSWRVSREALDTLELKWTGKDRENMSLYSPKKVFLVTTTVSAYLSPDWQQTRELCCLAVSEGVLEELFQHANLNNNQHSYSSDFPWVEDHIFVSVFELYLTMAVKDNLFAAISRSSVSTKLFTEPTKAKPDEGRDRGTIWVKSAENISGNNKYRFDAAITPDCHAYTRGFVSSIYNLHKIGRNEPSSSILRVSSRLDKQERPKEYTTESMWPCIGPFTTLADQEQNIIFVSSKNPGNVSQYAELCAFLMDASRIDVMIDQDKPEQSSTACTFQAMRMDTKPGWGGGWNRTDVQINDMEFLDNKTKFLSYLKGLESFAKYRKGKGAEPPAPAKLWKPKKMYSHYVTAMSKPQSFQDVLKFREMMAKKGRRITTITEPQRSYSQAELLQLVLGVSNDPKHEASRTSDIPSTSDSVRNDLPDQVQSRSSLEDSDSIHIKPKGHLDERGNSPETNSRPRKRKSLDVASNTLEADDDERLTEQDQVRGASVSNSERTPVLVLRDRVPKRHFDASDMEMASPSVGPSKRPRQENQSQFDNDYLNDEELNFLLDNGCFAE